MKFCECFLGMEADMKRDERAGIGGAETVGAEVVVPSRRNMLKGLATGAAGAAGVAVGAVVGSEPAAAGGKTEADKKKARYKVTDHVKAYYRTNRY